MRTWDTSGRSRFASPGSRWCCRRCVLNYLGQGALLLANPQRASTRSTTWRRTGDCIRSSCSRRAPTVIASQAVISGAFSLTQQAMQLGYSPRFDIQHTSAQEKGQVYIPEVNWLLMLATVGLVLGFRTSTNLAAAYGMAVTTTMVITTMLVYRRGEAPMGMEHAGAPARCRACSS